MSFLKEVLRGIAIGVANIIPGVSGGTMMVSMGIYGDVIGAVLLLNMDQKDLFEEREICLAEYTAKVLGKQMEQ